MAVKLMAILHSFPCKWPWFCLDGSSASSGAVTSPYLALIVRGGFSQLHGVLFRPAVSAAGKLPFSGLCFSLCPPYWRGALWLYTCGSSLPVFSMGQFLWSLYFYLSFIKKTTLPQPVWPSWWGIAPHTQRSLVRLLVRAPGVCGIFTVASSQAWSLTNSISSPSAPLQRTGEGIGLWFRASSHGLAFLVPHPT